MNFSEYGHKESQMRSCKAGSHVPTQESRQVEHRLKRGRKEES